MSKQAEKKIKCERCGLEQTFIIWESLNVTLDPGQKRELLEGKFTYFICKNCQWSSRIVYPLLYHDMGKRFMIWLWTGSNDPTNEQLLDFRLVSSYQYRLVTSIEELIEKILIFDQGLDDRIIEMYKLRLIGQFENDPEQSSGKIYFLNIGKSDTGEVMELFYKHENDIWPFHLALKNYQEFVDVFSKKIPALQTELDKWLRVDPYYAASAITINSGN